MGQKHIWNLSCLAISLRKHFILFRYSVILAAIERPEKSKYFFLGLLTEAENLIRVAISFSLAHIIVKMIGYKPNNSLGFQNSWFVIMLFKLFVASSSAPGVFRLPKARPWIWGTCLFCMLSVFIDFRGPNSNLPRTVFWKTVFWNGSKMQPPFQNTVFKNTIFLSRHCPIW